MDVRIDGGLRIHALDGFELAATLYRPDRGEDRETAVLINSATAVKRGYYDPFARYLAGEGLTVLTYDYRGIGGSRPRNLSRFPARLRQWAEEDQGGALDWIAGHLHPRKILVVGHSVGGQIVGLAPGNERIAGMVGVAGEARVDHRHVTPREVGAPAIGHFGFFRERFRDTLWRESAGWLKGQAA